MRAPQSPINTRCDHISIQRVKHVWGGPSNVIDGVTKHANMFQGPQRVPYEMEHVSSMINDIL